MSKQRIVKTVLTLAWVIVLVLGSTTLASAGKPTPTPTTPPPPPTIPAGLRAGLRASDYGISPWPSPTWWVNSINSMAAKFPPATGATTGEMIAVVVEIDGMHGPGCWAHFSNPDGGTYPGVRFDAADEFEPAFAMFDGAGIKVWLQVEASACDMSMLIDLVMKQYGHHSSVIGFGVDAEWYLNKSYRNGKPVTDAEAQAWVAKTRTYNSGYQVFLKHWLADHMPPTYRTGLVFIDDSQGFRSFDAMVSEFTLWGQTFNPAPVGFQYGYASDKSWWSKLSDPPKDIGDAILRVVPNTRDLVWVDFTAYDIWPPQ